MTIATLACGAYLFAGVWFAVGVYYAVHKPERWTWSSPLMAGVFYATLISSWPAIVAWPAIHFIVSTLRGRRRVESHRL